MRQGRGDLGVRLLTLTLLASLAPLPAATGSSSPDENEECRVVQDHCDFPFDHGDQSKDSCVKIDADDRYLCKQNTAAAAGGPGGSFTWGVCNGNCLDQETGGPIEFGGDMFSMSMFCKNQPVSCVFPFKYGGVEYRGCTADIGDGQRHWCATKVDGDGNAADNFWGVCDMDLCGSKDRGPEDIPPNTDSRDDSSEEGGKVATLKISASGNAEGVAADITFIQADREANVIIKGLISGLKPGNHGVHIHELPAQDGDCLASGAHFNPFNSSHGDATDPERTLYTTHPGDLGNVLADENGVASVRKVVPNGRMSLFEDGQDSEISIIGRTLVIHGGEDDLGAILDDPLSQTVGNSGSRLACGVVALAYDTPKGVSTTLLIVIILLLLLLILLAIVLICYCHNKKNKKKWTPLPQEGNKPVLDEEELPYQNGGPKKRPLYDELSIPFIDASPVPSPKLGRSSNRSGNICATSEDISP